MKGLMMAEATPDATPDAMDSQAWLAATQDQVEA